MRLWSLVLVVVVGNEHNNQSVVYVHVCCFSAHSVFVVVRGL